MLELLATLAFLVIVLGLMVSLARFVRATSAERITRGLLNRARDALVAESVSTVSALPPAGADEGVWSAYARQTAPAVRRLLGPVEADTDAWGTPLCYVPRSRPDIGMAPGDRPFCLSAGPDGRYLTRDDNLYSYDELPVATSTAGWPAQLPSSDPSVSLVRPQGDRPPAVGGHGE